MIIRSKRKVVVGFLFAFSFVFVFNLYREGIEVLVTKTALYGAAVLLVVILCKFLVVVDRSIRVPNSMR